MNKHICIFGTSGFAKEVRESISETYGYFPKQEVWLVTDKQDEADDKRIIHEKDVEARDLSIFAIADTYIRERLANKFEAYSFLTFRDHGAWISDESGIGKGTMILKGSVITHSTVIGRHCIINLNCTIGHNCRIGDFVTISPGVNISGNVTIGNHCSIGTNAAIRQGVTICSDVTIGMGAVVLKDITEAGTYVGVPAKKK